MRRQCLLVLLRRSGACVRAFVGASPNLWVIPDVNRWPWMAECPRSPKTLSSHELAYLQDGERGPVATLPTKALCALPPLHAIRSLLCEKLPFGSLDFSE